MKLDGRSGERDDGDFGGARGDLCGSGGGGGAGGRAVQFRARDLGNVEPGKPVDFPPGTAVSQDLFKRIGPDDASATRRVTVPYFQAQFVTASKKSSSRSWATIRQNFALEGLSQADMQGIADTLYARFTADLTKQGLTVVPWAEARAASPGLTSLLAAGKPAPYSGKTSDGTISTIATAGGLPIYFHAEDPEKSSLGGYVSNRSYWHQPAAAKELGAALVGVRIAVNFVEQKNNDQRGLFGFRSSTGKLKSSVALTIEPITTHVWVAGPTRQASIVGQPVSPSRYILTAPLILPADAIMSVGAGTDTGPSGLMRTFFGGGADSYVVRVDPVAFRRDVGGAMGDVADALAVRAAASINAKRG